MRTDAGANRRTAGAEHLLAGVSARGVGGNTIWNLINSPRCVVCVCARPQAQLLESKNRSGETEGKRKRGGEEAVHRRRVEERAMRARENDAGAQRAQQKTQADLLALLAQLVRK